MAEESLTKPVANLGIRTAINSTTNSREKVERVAPMYLPIHPEAHNFSIESFAHCFHTCVKLFLIVVIFGYDFP